VQMLPEIRSTLQEQVTATVRWQDCIERMLARGCEFFIELGSGNVLAGLVQRIRKGTAVVSVGDAESARRCAEAMRALF
jgi:[acyl-carrier-protein] S-malonyltransferase